MTGRWHTTLHTVADRISDRDYQILRSIAEHRFLTTHQIHALHFADHTTTSGGRIARRTLARLRSLGLTDILERRIGGVRAGSAGLVHHLTDAGYRLTDGRRRRTQNPTHAMSITTSLWPTPTSNSWQLTSAVTWISLSQYRGGAIRVWAEHAAFTRNTLSGLKCHYGTGSQFTSIRYGERLAEIGALPPIGSVGDSFDNALAETVNGYYKAELVYGPARTGPWKPSTTSSWPP